MNNVKQPAPAEQTGLFDAIRRQLKNILNAGDRRQQLSDDDIRRSIGGASATSNHKKPKGK
jgi:hypothetical protein